MFAWIVIAIMVLGLVIAVIGRIVLGRGGATSAASVALAVVVLVIVLGAIYAFERAAINIATQPGTGGFPTPGTQIPTFGTPPSNNAIAP